MKKTTPTKKKTVKKSSARPAFDTGADLKSAVLIISLLLNLAVTCLWITLQITSQYDAVLADFFINR